MVDKLNIEDELRISLFKKVILMLEDVEIALNQTDEDCLFEEKTRQALKRVENNPNRVKLSKDEFFKELESW